jgi:hypothetical protein
LIVDENRKTAEIKDADEEVLYKGIIDDRSLRSDSIDSVLDDLVHLS